MGRDGMLVPPYFVKITKIDHLFSLQLPNPFGTNADSAITGPPKRFLKQATNDIDPADKGKTKGLKPQTTQRQKKICLIHGPLQHAQGDAGFVSFLLSAAALAF